MEKLMYALWPQSGQSPEDFCRSLRLDLAPLLSACEGVKGLQFNLSDEDAAPAEALRMSNTRPPCAAVASLWMETAIRRQEVQALLEQFSGRIAGYLVTESQPLVNTEHCAPAGERTPAYAQIVFLQVPPRLNYAAWLEYWHGTHTGIAIETQDTFLYRQNVVVRPLTYGAPPCDAIIEECFPMAAMTDPAVFYDAVGDEGKLQRNSQAMLDSCVNFIDFDKIDVIPTSQYIISG